MNRIAAVNCWLNGLPLVALVLLSGCKDVLEAVKPKLPEATQEGNNTFGCLVDDKLWLPYTEHTLDSDVEADYQRGVLTLHAEQEHESKPSQYVFLRAANPAGGELVPGTYPLGNGFAGRLEVHRIGQYQYYRHRTGSQGSLTITKVEPRTVTTTVLGQQLTSYHTIVSGTFHFTATDSVSGKTITVQDGRFDVRAR